MCGIAGIFNRDGAPVDESLLVRMTRSLVHRGPDEEGYFVEGDRVPAGPMDRIPWRRFDESGSSPRDPRRAPVGLGHRRLSIIDLASGQQPLCNEDGSIWISFNGEIYNFQSLASDLESRGHRFRTHSDTETIVHAYEEWGESFLTHLRGMFAFALWDSRERKMLLARDRVGKKPLYYMLDDERLLFASEIKAILQDERVSRDVDFTALSDYLSLLYVPSPKSIFQSIRKLPAAHYAVIGESSSFVKPYWDLSFAPDDGADESQVMDELVATLEEAVRLRMISEVPLGAFLSGGVDSSAVVGLMAGCSDNPVITNSISFSVSAYDESVHARSVADMFKTNHNEFHVTPEAIPVIEKLSWNYDEPFADSSSVPTYYVSKTTRERVTVALSGDGGDENFAGYRRYYFDMREHFVRNMLPPLLGRPFFRFLGHLYPKADYLPQVFRGKAFISNVARDPIDAYFFSMSALHEEQKAILLKPEVSERLRGYASSELFRDIYRNAPANDHLSRIQYLDIKTYLCEDILTKVDRASMAVSLEVRCPVLDHLFMERAARIPSTLKLSGMNGKHIFKKSLRRLLPADILHRKKMGFGVPILEWLRHDLKDYAERLVLHGRASHEWLSGSQLRRMWEEHQRGVRNRSTELWSIMMLNLWFERFHTSTAPSRHDVETG